MLERRIATLPATNKLLSPKFVGVLFLYVLVQLFAIGEGLVTSVWPQITLRIRDHPLTSRADLHGLPIAPFTRRCSVRCFWFNK